MSYTGKFGEEPYYPMVGFFFTLSFSKIPDKTVDAKFKEVSGIEMTLNTTTIPEGGENGSQWEVPDRTKFSDLVLKRGVLSSQSKLTQWCYSWLLNDYSKPLERKDVYLKLLNEKGTAIMVWQFENAFPYKLNLGGFNSMATGEAAIVIETITLKYQNIKILK
jgi:phage tail-like protein